MRAGLSLVDYVGKDADADMKCGFHAGVFAGYTFYDNIYAEIGIGVGQKGYKKDVVISSGPYWSDDGDNYDKEVAYKMNTLNLDIPISIGYRYNGFFGQVGPYLTYALNGSLKAKGYERTYSDIHSSETGKIDDSTDIGEGSLSNFKKFGVGINVCIGYEYQNFMISAAYQRGLTKLEKNGKIYEQNILITLGYKFNISF